MKTSAYEIIKKKRDGQTLTEYEIKWFIDSLVSGEVKDYQMSALLMAIFLNGLDVLETAALTDAMLNSGTTLNFNDEKVIDKHSTGGVGDKTSFILAPIAAACGVKVPMIAGRGLGHTGGTVDKIEAIPGFNVSIDTNSFKKKLDELGLVLIGQTKDIAPADRIIYGLRDVTATVESIPLITASIMSKKLAEGTSGIVMDIKVGSGAFMKTLADGRKLAKSIQNTATRFGRNIFTIISDMSQPLGTHIGNSLELIECFEILKGNIENDLSELSLELAGAMVYLAGISKTHAKGKQMAKSALTSGKALEKFKEMIISQGGDSAVIDNYDIMPLAKCRYDVVAKNSGFITTIDCERVGMMIVDLGGGRRNVGDKLDYGVGMIIDKKVGDKIKKGDVIVTFFYNQNQESLVGALADEFGTKVIKVGQGKPKQSRPLIIETMEKWSK